MTQAGVCAEDRKVVGAAQAKAEATGAAAAAIELPDGTIVTGKTSSLLGAPAAAVINALKVLGGISDEMYILAPIVIEPLHKLKIEILGNHNPRLHVDEILIALSISATTNPVAAQAVKYLPKLRGCEAHSTVILSQTDTDTFRKLGMNLTCDPQYQTKKLFHS